jgi:hypothetical protein
MMREFFPLIILCSFLAFSQQKIPIALQKERNNTEVLNSQEKQEDTGSEKSISKERNKEPIPREKGAEWYQKYFSQFNYPLLFIVSGLILCFLFLLFFLKRYLRKRKKNKLKSVAIPICISSGIEVSDNIKEAGTPTPKVSLKAQPKQSAQSNHFDIQFFISSGPRKSFPDNTIGQDSELGEDVAGFRLLPNAVHFWLLDGTNQQSIIKLKNPQREIFSSRILAQKLAAYFSEIASEFPDIPVIKILPLAEERLLDEWRRFFGALSEDEKNCIIKDYLLDSEASCSTTIVLGRLDKDGTCDIIRLGDSNVISFSSNNEIHRIGNASVEKYGRLYFSLHTPDRNSIEVFDYREKDDKTIQSLRCNLVERLYVLSDGIGSITENYLTVSRDLNLSNLLTTISQQPQKTYDDKSLLIINRI